MRGSEEEEEEAVASKPGQWVSTLAAHAPTRAHATSPRVQARARLYEQVRLLEVGHLDRNISRRTSTTKQCIMFVF